MQMLIRRAMVVIRRAMSVLASEDAVSKQAILPVAWVAAVLMAAAVVLMPEKAQAETCWAAWHCNNHHPYWCKEECRVSCSDTSGWACVRYGSGPYRCKCL